MRFRFSIAGLIGLCLLALLHPMASARPKKPPEPPPPEAAEWVERFRSYYRHYDSFEASSGPYYGGTFEPNCHPRSPFMGKLQFEPWTLGVHLKHHDENLFFKHLYLAVRKLREPQDVIALFKAAKQKHNITGLLDTSSNPDASACSASYHYEVVIQSGPYVIAFDGTCNQMGTVFPYEVADVIDLLRSAGLPVAPELVYNRCGAIEINVTATDGIVAESKKRRKLYDHVLPQDREAAKQKARQSAPAAGTEASPPPPGK